MTGRVQLVPITHGLAARVGLVLDRPHIGYVGMEDAPRSRGKRSVVLDGKRKRIVGAGGLFWRDGLCWLWLGGVDMKHPSAITVIRMAKEMLRRAEQLGEEHVYTPRDPEPCAEKLLTMLGFERQPDHPFYRGLELWRH